MKHKQKPLTIAIEAFALGDNFLSGIGTLALNYLKQIQKLDKENKYIIYSMRTQKHLTVTLGTCKYHSWKLVDTFYNKREKPIGQTCIDSNDNHLIKLYFRIIQKIIGVSLVMLQWFYKRWVPFSLWINRVDLYVSTSAYFYPPFFLSRLRKISFVYDLSWKLFPETLDPGNRNQMQQCAEKNMKNADQLVSISENTKKEVITLFHIQTNNKVITPAADTEMFYPAKSSLIKEVKGKYSISKKYILSVCTLEPRKNLKSLLRAYAKMKNVDNYELVLTGKMGWLLSDLSDYIKNLDIEDNVVLTGYAPSEDLSPLYSGAEVFVYPSVYEGFGLPILEAMQCGCPVIAANNSSIPEVTGEAGMLIETNNLEALIKSLEEVVTDSNLREKMRKKGLKRAVRFSWEKSAKQFLELYC